MKDNMGAMQMTEMDYISSIFKLIFTQKMKAYVNGQVSYLVTKSLTSWRFLRSGT